MGTFGRIIVTLAVWFMVPMSLYMTQGMNGGEQVAVVLILAVAATVTSGAIWNAHSAGQAQAQTEKAKRGGSRRVDRLLAGLDEDDLAALRARMLADHDETPVPLDTLLAARDRRADR